MICREICAFLLQYCFFFLYSSNSYHWPIAQPPARPSVSLWMIILYCSRLASQRICRSPKSRRGRRCLARNRSIAPCDADDSGGSASRIHLQIWAGDSIVSKRMYLFNGSSIYTVANEIGEIVRKRKGSLVVDYSHNVYIYIMDVIIYICQWKHLTYIKTRPSILIPCLLWFDECSINQGITLIGISAKT